MKISKIKLSSDIRRTQIVESAISIAAAGGARAITTSAISKKVGFSEANIYRHFKNKDEILFETINYIGEHLKNNVLSSLDNKEFSFDNIRMLAKVNLEFIQENPGIPRLIFSEDIHIGKEKIRKRLYENINKMAELIGSYLLKGQDTGHIKKDINTKSLAFILISMMQGLVLRWSLSKMSFNLFEEGINIFKNLELMVMEKKR